MINQLKIMNKKVAFIKKKLNFFLFLNTFCQNTATELRN